MRGGYFLQSEWLVLNSPKILATDVQYSDDSTARAAGVLFSRWDSAEADREVVAEVVNVADYEPGQFYLRELPCLLRLIQVVQCRVDVMIVDGYVWLDHSRPGLGAKLFQAIDEKVPVIGVAKSRFRDAPAIEIRRGTSQSPLFITAVGMLTTDAAGLVQKMDGDHRIPTLLRRVDQLCRALVQPKPESSN